MILCYATEQGKSRGSESVEAGSCYAKPGSQTRWQLLSIRGWSGVRGGGKSKGFHWRIGSSCEEKRLLFVNTTDDCRARPFSPHIALDFSHLRACVHKSLFNSLHFPKQKNKKRRIWFIFTNYLCELWERKNHLLMQNTCRLKTRGCGA